MNGVGHGQIWWADMDKVQPVLVLTRSRVAPLLTRILVAPITTVDRGIATEVALGMTEGVAEGSVAFDNIQLVPIDRLLRRVGVVDAAHWQSCCAAVHAVMAC